MTAILSINKHRWYHATSRHGKPQAMASAHGRKFKHSVLVCRCAPRGRYLFSTFKTKEDLWKYFLLTPPNDRYFRTIDTSFCDGTTSALYLDVEWKTACDRRDDYDKQRIELLRIGVQDALLRSGGTAGVDQMHVADFTRVDDGSLKHSYHLHFPGVVFSDTLMMGTFIKTLVVPACIDDHLFYDGEGCPVLDTTIYTKNRQLRLPGCKKAWTRAPMHLATPPRDLFMASITSGCSSPVNVGHVHSRLDGITIRQTAQQRQHVTPENKALENRITALLRMKGDTTSAVRYVSGRLFRLEGSEQSCLVGGRACTASGMDRRRYFIVYDDGRIFFHCLIDAVHAASAGAYVGDTSPENSIEWDGDEFVGTTSRFDGWDARLRILRREFDDRYTREFTLEFGRKALLVVAGMGKGKTTSAIALVCNRRFKRILYVVPRRTLGLEILRVINRHPDTPEFQYYTDGVDGHFLIIEYESLHRLRGNLAYCLVICDEVRTLGNAMTNAVTNGYNLQRNSAILRALSTNCIVWVGMDADAEVDAVVPHLVQTWWPTPGHIQIDVYTVPAMYRELYLTSNEPDWVSDVRARLSDGKQVAICCRTKARAHVWNELLDNPNSLLIDGDTNDDVVATTLGLPGTDDSIDTALTPVKLFIFTSKLNIGVDIQLQWDHVFIDGAGGRGASARDLIQMAGRFRNLVNVHVKVLVASTIPVYESLDDLTARVMAYYDRRVDLFDNYRVMLSYDAIFRDGYLVMAPDWITMLFVYTSLERHADFTYELYRLCRLNKYKAFRVHGDPVKSDEVKTTKKHVKDTKQLTLEEVFEAVKTEDPTAVLVNGHELSRTGQGTIENTMRIECAESLRYFTDHSTATFDQFQLVSSNLNQLRMLTINQRMTTARLLRHEVQALHRHPWSNHTIFSKLMQCRYIDECLATLGIGGIDDTATSFTSDDLFANATAILKSLLDAAAAGCRPYNSKKVPKVLTVLRRELRETYGIALKTKRRHGKLYDYNLERPKDLMGVLPLLDFGYNFDRSPPTEYDDYIEECHARAAELRTYKISA